MSRISNLHPSSNLTCMSIISSSASLPFPDLCLHIIFHSDLRTAVPEIHNHVTADGDSWVLSAEEFADGMLKAGYEEIEKSLRKMVLKASSEIAAGAAVRYSKMSVVARRENQG